MRRIRPARGWAVTAHDENGHVYLAGGAHIAEVTDNVRVLVKSMYAPTPVTVLATNVETDI